MLNEVMAGKQCLMDDARAYQYADKNSVASLVLKMELAVDCNGDIESYLSLWYRYVQLRYIDI